ncbi:MAG: hypothetical protein ABIQ61_00755 [Ornithinibacter sp.]
MSTVPGDPASLSACAGTVRRVSGELTLSADGIRAAGDALGVQWQGRTSARVRKRTETLAAANDTTAQQLDRVGVVLQDHASELADLVARARMIDERAAAAGLEVREGRVIVAFGVTGTADGQRASAQEATRARLQGDLDLVLAQHRRRRDWVLEVLRESSIALEQVSHGLRQG